MTTRIKRTKPRQAMSPREVDRLEARLRKLHADIDALITMCQRSERR